MGLARRYPGECPLVPHDPGDGERAVAAGSRCSRMHRGPAPSAVLEVSRWGCRPGSAPPAGEPGVAASSIQSTWGSIRLSGSCCFGGAVLALYVAVAGWPDSVGGDGRSSVARDGSAVVSVGAGALCRLVFVGAVLASMLAVSSAAGAVPRSAGSGAESGGVAIVSHRPRDVVHADSVDGVSTMIVRFADGIDGGLGAQALADAGVIVYDRYVHVIAGASIGASPAQAAVLRADPADRRGGTGRSGDGVRRAGRRRRPCCRGADVGDVGSRSDRPARPAAVGNVSVHVHGGWRHRVCPRHGCSRRPRRLRWSGRRWYLADTAVLRTRRL